MASPRWSPWPWVTRRTSHQSSASALRGDLGLPNHGSNSTVVPLAETSSTHAWPNQVNRAPVCVSMLTSVDGVAAQYPARMELLHRVTGPVDTNVWILGDEASREAICIDAATPSVGWITDSLAASMQIASR